MFAFTSNTDDLLIRKTIETLDNVVPASNSIMAKNLYRLSKLLFNSEYEELAKQMLRNLRDGVLDNTQSHSNWLQLALFFNQPYYEIAIVGESYIERAKEIGQNYLPNTVLAATKAQSELPILQDRFEPSETLIYVCEGGSCKLPVSDLSEALKQVEMVAQD